MDATAHHSPTLAPVGQTPHDRPMPISRWYAVPLVERLAGPLAARRLSPHAVTVAGLALAMAAAALLVAAPSASPAAAALVLGAWLCDRLDGPLARRRRMASAAGTWLDANVDELVDLGLHASLAIAAWRQTASDLPLGLLAAVLAGKYLFMYGLNVEEHLRRMGRCDAASGAAPSEPRGTSRRHVGWLRRLYHLPADADVRIHLLLAALATGWFTAELTVVAVYYNVRWMVRYALVLRRLRGQP